LIGRFQRRQRMLKDIAKHPPSPIGNGNQTIDRLLFGLDVDLDIASGDPPAL